MNIEKYGFSYAILKSVSKNAIIRTWNMLVTPFANDDVFPSFPDHVVHLVIIVSQVLYEHFITRPLGSIHANVHDIVPYTGKEGRLEFVLRKVKNSIASNKPASVALIVN